MQKWEYCTVVGVERKPGWDARDPRTRYPAVWFFTEGGIEVREIEDEDEQELARQIASLGQGGWEMVGVGHFESPSSQAIYFKRPLS